MDPISSKTALAAAGAGGEKVYVDDVFSTYLYNGTGAAQTITNGVDLSGEGGMVWTKSRSLSEAHMVFDTERGVQKSLFTNNYNAESTSSTTLTAFNSDGFTIGTNNIFNTNGSTNCSWTFRKAPGFLDIVTWSGNNTAGRVISHDLGSVPGMIIIKSTSSTYDWVVWHREIANSEYLYLNTNAAKASSDNYFNNTTPDASGITLSGSGHVNGNGETYVAYIFAHDDQSFGTSGNEAIIKCGSWTNNSSGYIPEVDLGFEPQFMLWKASTTTSDWYISDSSRGWLGGSTIGGGSYNMIEANSSDAESLSSGANNYASGALLTSTGFVGDGANWGANQTYIYMAIRRPHKPPVAGTDVFTTAYRDASEPGFNSTFPVDLAFEQYTTGGNSSYPGFGTRLTGPNQLTTSSTASEVNNSTYDWDYMDGWNNVESTSTTIFSHMFKRAPGFMDVVTYKGNGTTNNQAHNLGAVPELMIFKNRDSAVNWMVWFGDGSNVLYLNRTNAKADEGLNLNSTTSTNIPIANSNSGFNNSGVDYVAFLFATLSGISKVGTYTGTGSDIDVDCGFTAGARYILIKRTDSTGDWYVWDSVRGIVSGNDPYLLLNSTAAQVTNTDYVDPLNAGFTVTSSAPAALNASGGTYLFLAIA